MATAQEVKAQYDTLSDSDKVVAAQAMGLGAPPKSVVGIIWMLIVGTLSLVVLVGMVLAFQLVNGGKDAGVFAGFVGGAIGALVGLLAPSPVKGSNS